jgi:hypothetical protein
VAAILHQIHSKAEPQPRMSKQDEVHPNPLTSSHPFILVHSSCIYYSFCTLFRTNNRLASSLPYFSFPLLFFKRLYCSRICQCSWSILVNRPKWAAALFLVLSLLRKASSNEARILFGCHPPAVLLLYTNDSFSLITKETEHIHPLVDDFTNSSLAHARCREIACFARRNTSCCTPVSLQSARL